MLKTYWCNECQIGFEGQEIKTENGWLAISDGEFATGAISWNKTQVFCSSCFVEFIVERFA